MNIKAQPAKRAYRMTARAEAAAATRERILDAAIAVFWERPVVEISLEQVAQRARVSLPTVIRHFGDRESLFTAAADRQSERVRTQRDEAPEGDLRQALRILMDHYEELGRSVLKLLAEEQHVPGLRAIADRGRAYHADWCDRVFAPALAAVDGDDRARRRAELIVVTDVLVWKLFRLDLGLSREQTELALRELIEPLTGGN